MIAQMKDKRKLKEKITQAVEKLYAIVANEPDFPFHFVSGERAAKVAGYPKKILAHLPQEALESFAGTGYHFQNNVIKKGDSVLDIGSGAGTDALIAAKLVGEKGRVFGIDITEEMIKKARKNANKNGLKNITIVKADAENLPFVDNFFDVVISNGVINLVLNKGKVFKEIYRVLKPGGTLSISDIVLGKAVSEESRKNAELWAECIVGALPEDECVQVIKKTGFRSVQIVDRIDIFAHSPSKNTREVAASFNAHGIVIKAEKKGGEKHGKN